MKFEKIKKVKLLVSLKGTEEGKNLVWLAGTEFDKEVAEFPPTIANELRTGRPRIFEILEAYEDDIIRVPELEKEGPEKPKEVPSKDKPRLKRRAI